MEPLQLWATSCIGTNKKIDSTHTYSQTVTCICIYNKPDESQSRSSAQTYSASVFILTGAGREVTDLNLNKSCVTVWSRGGALVSDWLAGVTGEISLRPRSEPFDQITHATRETTVLHLYSYSNNTCAHEHFTRTETVFTTKLNKFEFIASD